MDHIHQASPAEAAPLCDDQRCGSCEPVRRGKELEAELAQARKLESVGRLAAGVAHEINTPVQFVGDSIHFVREGVADLMKLVDRLGAMARQAGLGDEVAVVAEECDLDYLRENLPAAIDRALDGLGRVAEIVRSMKEFAHSDGRDAVSVDLNRAVRSTLLVARNEYKYVADLVTDLAELPPVSCHVGEVNQVVLNLVVNAAHAIGEVVKGNEGRGSITVRTRIDGDHVVLSVTDTGGGIPEAVRPRIFEPFFTTKEVGKGTGQGLALSRQIVEQRHGGTLTFETEEGVGTTFVVRLPLTARALPEEEVAA